MLLRKLPEVPFKGTDPTEPFIGENAQGILITGKARSATYLLRSHIGEGASHLLARQLFQ